jgi:hypothetical protein
VGAADPIAGASFDDTLCRDDRAADRPERILLRTAEIARPIVSSGSRDPCGDPAASALRTQTVTERERLGKLAQN